jgi:hypothetical protein
VDAPFNPFAPRATETAKPSVAPQSDTPLASGSVGAVGTAVKAGARAAPGSDLLARALTEQGGDGGSTGGSAVRQAGSSGSGLSGSGAGTATGTGTGTGQTLPFVDPGGRYQVDGNALKGRTATGDLPDLRGLRGGDKTIVKVKVLVASSGIVMDPRVVQGSDVPEIDSRIRIAVGRWLFSPVADDAGSVETTITFFIVPKS